MHGDDHNNGQQEKLFSTCLGVASVDHYSRGCVLNGGSHAIKLVPWVGSDILSIALGGSIVDSSRVAYKVTVKENRCSQLIRIGLYSKKTTVT